MDENLIKDRLLSRTNAGIHKDDVIFKINGEALKNYASQGQLKSFVLALKLAQYKIIESATGKKPLILLDDIFDRLDSSRVERLMIVLKENKFGQIFITDTQESRIITALEQSFDDYKVFAIENGAIIN